MKAVLLFIVLALAPLSAAFAAEGPVLVRLSAQLWARPVGIEDRLNIRMLGKPVAVTAKLELRDGLNKYKLDQHFGLIRSSTTFTLVPAVNADPAYVVTHVRLFNAGTDALIAECSNYDSIQAENNPGVGACSGIIGGSQFGLTFFRVVP